MIKVLIAVFLMVWIALPYLILFYKKVSVSIRLLFASMFEILCLLILIIATHWGGLDFLTGTVFFYNMIVWSSVLINVFVILVIWILKKVRKYDAKE